MNRTLSALLISCFTMGVPAVTQAKKDLFIGLKGGISIPSLRAGESKNDWNKNYASRVGPYFGAYAEVQLSRYFSFQPEINYAAEGGKRHGIQPMTIPAQYVDAFKTAFNTDQDYLFADLKGVSRVNYLQIPLMLKFHYPLAFAGKLKFFVQAGPYLGYMVAAKQLIKTDDLKVYMDGAGKRQIPPVAVATFFGTTIDTAIDARSDLHDFNFGFQCGMGFSYDVGRSKVFIEGGGNYGFMYIQKGNNHGKNNIGAGTVLVGVAYNVRKKKA